MSHPAAVIACVFRRPARKVSTYWQHPISHYEKSSACDLYKNDLHTMAPFLDFLFQLKRLETTESAKKTSYEFSEGPRVLNTALPLQAGLVEWLFRRYCTTASDGNTSDTDETISLRVFKGKFLFSYYDGSKLTTTKTRSSFTEIIPDHPFFREGSK